MNKEQSRAKQILVVDDDETVRHLLHCIFDKAKYEVTEASNGDNALTIARNQFFDLAFVDLVMPGIDGIQTCKWLRQIQPHIHIVMVTGYMQSDETLRESGADAILRKAFSPTTVVSLAEKLLAEEQ